MNYEQAMKAFRKLDEDDPAAAHREAELILIGWLRANGQPQLATAFEDARRRVGFWYA